MSGDLIGIDYALDTNEFVENLKSLSSSATAVDYSSTIDRLLVQLKERTPEELMESKPLILALIEHLYRVVPVLDQKIAEGHRRTYLLLETLAKVLNGACVLNVFFSIKDASRLELIFQSYLPFLEEKFFFDHLQESDYDPLINCFLPILAYASLLVSVDEHHFSADLLNRLLTFLNEHWRSKSREAVVKNILVLMKILSKTPAMVAAIIRSDWPKTCLIWLTMPGHRPSFDIDFLICLLLQKIARHTAGVQLLNQLNCRQILKDSEDQMKKDHRDNDYISIHFLQCIIYALLVESDEIKQKSIVKDPVLSQTLEQLISYIVQSSRTQTFVFRGCHISEILCVLSKLFVNDDIVEKCLTDNPAVFDCLCRLLLHFTMVQSETSKVYQALNDGALTTIVNLLWSISFHSPFHEKFKSNSILMHTLANLATSSSLYVGTPMKSAPTDIFPLKQAAEGIFWNLKSSRSIGCPRKRAETLSVMISYSHSDGQFCRQLVEHLSAHVSVWVDYQQLNQHLHSDDLWEDIAKAMEGASVIVLILSKEYYNSKSCRQELSYATDALKKRILPIYAPNQDYKASGWLGIRIAGQKYVHFGRKLFNEAVNEVLSLILPDQKPAEIVHMKDPPKEKPMQEEPSLRQWTSKEIRQWFLENQIHPDLVALFADEFRTGTALLAYAHHLKQCYRNEYMQIMSNYRAKYQGKCLQTVHFIALVDALWQLRDKYESQSPIDNPGSMQHTSCASISPFPIKLRTETITWF